MSKKFAIPRRGAGKATLVIRRKAAPVAPTVVDHSKVALFGSASAVALAALLTVGFMASPVQAAPASCSEVGGSGTGNWFCNNNPPEVSGDIDGNANDNSIVIVGGSYTFGDYPSSTVYGGAGADTITLQPDPNKGGSSIAFDGNVNGDTGKDTITIGGGGLPSPGVAWVNVNGDVDGGDDDDVINITASDEVLASINKDEGKTKGGNVRGGDGDDKINITNASKMDITIEDSVQGGDGKDTIKVTTSEDANIKIGVNVDGDDGEDAIELKASGTSSITAADVTGGEDDDTIDLIGESGGTIKVNNVNGDAGKDKITINGSGDSSITVDKGIDGGEGNDTIDVTASFKSVVDLGEVKGGQDDDTIKLTAKGDGKIYADKISGDNGADSITIEASSNGKVFIDKNIEGGDDADTIKVTVSNTAEFEATEIKGGQGDDAIDLIAEGGSIEIDKVAGDEGSDKITIAASVDGDIKINENIDGGEGADTIKVTTSDTSKFVAKEINGGKDDDTIELTAKNESEIKVSAVKGDEGKDTITISASDKATITIDKNIEGGEGADTIEVKSVDTSKVTLGDIKGGKDDDTIKLTTEGSGTLKAGAIDGEDGDDKISISATGGDITVTDVNGRDGDDSFTLLADKEGKIHLNQIEGNDGKDIISLTAQAGGLIDVENDIEGGDGRDEITLAATGKGVINIDDVQGGDGDDKISLGVTTGGKIDMDDLEGGSGQDTITVKADAGEISLDDVRGGSSDDKISLSATAGGKIAFDNLDGGSGEDTISLNADGGEIRVNDIEGEDGDDIISLTATAATGTLISVDDIRGGDGDDDVTLSGLNNILDGSKNFEISGEIDGGDDFDRLYVKGGSALSLNDVDRFQELHVETKSFLQLTQQTIKFNGADEREGLVQVDATSYLRLSDHAAVLETGNVVLDAAGGLDGYRSIYTGRDAGWLNQTGGVLDVSGYSVAVNDRVELSVTDGVVPNPLRPERTFINNGTIALHNGISDVVGDRLTINGNYQGGGNLLIDTYLGASNSPTDILVINGDVDPKTVTTIYVNNTNAGQGVYTGTGLGQGIKVVDVAEWGTSPTDTFQLARNSVSGQREVMAGAYSYRLFQDPDNEITLNMMPMGMPDPDTGAGDWYLRAGYTAQATGYATAPSAIQRHFYAGLDTLHKRLGEVRQQDQLEGRNADLAGPVTKAPAYQPVPAPKFQMWGRGGGSDLSYDVSNGWDFSQKNWGLQAGGDYTFDYDSWRITAGAFGGYGWSDVSVDGDWSSWGGSSSLDINGWNAGIYASIRQVGLVRGAGFYTDLVGKVDVLDLDITSTSNVTANTNATVWGGSIEMGYGFELANSWVIQPQAQLAYVSANQDAYVDSIGTYVTPGDAESLIGRLGLQVQSTFVMATGQTVTPYAIFNVNSEFLGDNKTNVAGTILTSDINGTWYNAGIGFTADLNGSVALFGNGEYNFGDVQGWAGQGGIKIRW